MASSLAEPSGIALKRGSFLRCSIPRNVTTLVGGARAWAAWAALPAASPAASAAFPAASPPSPLRLSSKGCLGAEALRLLQSVSWQWRETEI